MQSPEKSHHEVMNRSERAMDESDRLFELFYKELRRHAQRQLRRMPPGQSLQPTALVHEAYMRLLRRGIDEWESRSHFMSIAIKVMRSVLIDALRRRCAIRRGGGLIRVELSDGRDTPALDAMDLLALSDALRRLESEYPDIAQVVYLRFLAGFTIKQIATMDGISVRTVERRWRFARAWLQAELGAA